MAAAAAQLRITYAPSRNSCQKYKRRRNNILNTHNGTNTYFPCAICGRADAAEFMICQDLKGVAEGDFSLVRCNSCGLVYMNPRPSPEIISSFYAGKKFDYYSGATSGHAAARAAWIEKYSPGKNILDIGAGDGSFLLHMKNIGWHATGVELEEEAARRQRDTHNLDVRTGTLAEENFSPASFDAITYWDVFEHIPDPVQELTIANRLLAPGGIIAFSLPNIESLEARIFGPKWYRLDMPRHLYHYSPRTLSLMLKKSGFSIAALKCSTTATGILNSLKPERIAERSEITSSENAPAANSAPSENTPPSSIKTAAKKAVFDLALVPTLKLLDALKLGGHFIAIARKK